MTLAILLVQDFAAITSCVDTTATQGRVLKQFFVVLFLAVSTGLAALLMARKFLQKNLLLLEEPFDPEWNTVGTKTSSKGKALSSHTGCVKHGHQNLKLF